MYLDIKTYVYYLFQWDLSPETRDQWEIERVSKLFLCKNETDRYVYVPSELINRATCIV